MEPHGGLQEIDSLSPPIVSGSKIKQTLSEKMRATNTTTPPSSSTPSLSTNKNTRSRTIARNAALDEPAHENYYEILSDNDDDIHSQISSRSAMSFQTQSRKRKLANDNPLTKKPKNSVTTAIMPKPPPITIPAMNRANAATFINSLPDSSNFEIRLSPDGIKIFAPTTDSYKAAKIKLQESGTKFFTHLLQEEQTSKFILHGYFAAELSDVHNHLKDAGVDPVRIKNISVRNKKYDDHAVYLVHFLKSDKMKLSTLQSNVKIINHVRVRWEFYQSKRNGPIQCSNCMSYGHGGASCYLSPKCIRCGNSHKSNSCPLAIDNNTNSVLARIPDDQVRCGLCGQNHPANFSGCVKRIEFIERQRNYRARAQARNRYTQQANHNTQIRHFTPAPQLNNSHFPSITPHQNSTDPAWQQVPTNQPAQPDLFTTDELLHILRDMMGRLKACTTKEQQFFALSEIATKYIYGK